MADIEALAKELSADPLARGYAEMTNQQAADDLNTAYRNSIRPLMATSKTLMARMDPLDAATILDKLESAAGSNSVVKWTMQHVTNDGIDLGHPNTRSQMQNLATDGVITDAEADMLLNLAVVTLTRAEELNLLGRSPEVGPAHVAEARN